MLKSTARIRRYVGDALHAFEHAPVEVTVSVLLAIAFSVMVADGAEPFPGWMEIAVTGALIAGTALFATLQHALGYWTARTRWIVTGAGVVVWALYSVLVLDLELAAEAWRAAALVCGAVLLLLAAPALAGPRDDATARFRRVTGRILIRTLAVGLYAVALYAGLALALGAVNTLFELDFDSRIYAHVAGWVFLVLVPWAIVGGVPDYVRPATEPGAVASAVHRLSAFLVSPLLAIYYLILYAYAVRILVTGELPKNLVSPLVIAAGLIAGLAIVLFDRQDEEGAPIQPLRYAALLFVPLALLGLYALQMRLGQYGWTEFRALRTVLLTALGLTAVAAAVLIVRRRLLPLHLLPIILAAALLLAVVGPWNVLAASRSSQQARLAAALESVGIDENTVLRDSVVSNDTYENISSTSRYLLRHFGAGALPPVLAAYAQDDQWVDLAHAVGLRRAVETADARGLYVQLEDGATFTDEAGATVMYLRLESFRAPGELRAPHARADSLRVVLNVRGARLFADLQPLLAGLDEMPQRTALPPDLARVLVTDSAGTALGELSVLEVGFGGQTGPKLYRLVGLLRLAPR